MVWKTKMLTHQTLQIFKKALNPITGYLIFISFIVTFSEKKLNKWYELDEKWYIRGGKWFLNLILCFLL